jgi:NAD(P)-dependent dehydrogenase (short-subunit alcohol dehydrogenase family)
MFKREGTVALVSGSYKGIEAGMAKGLADVAAVLVVTCASSQTRTGRVVSKIVARGGQADSERPVQQRGYR